MKVQEILLEMYTAYVLTEESRDMLQERFPPQYSKFIGHHITINFGVPADTEVPENAQIKVVGRKDSGDGLEVLVVSVNGSTQRENGGIYHITWSLDPDKYAPKDSNALLQDSVSKYTVSLPISIETEPQLLK